MLSAIAARCARCRWGMCVTGMFGKEQAECRLKELIVEHLIKDHRMRLGEALELAVELMGSSDKRPELQLPLAHPIFQASF